ncbi:protein-ADP-ribose hydrolase [Eubacterium sp. MSJ-13]|uniref:protein-ADP-ribose hydrolase n=1 Tax=Eubacterium sp. MSJ-13 TaxID=2841513 RepID=UPI001C124706|nr:protein-ADP-ribose hydrolase [Eubacterium sp. MSJ-13]
MNQSERRRFLIDALLKEQQKFSAFSGNSDADIPADKDGQKTLLRSLMNIRMPHEADTEFIKVQDEYLRQANEEKGIVTLDDIDEVSEDIYVWKGDITRLKAGAIVNAANSGMTGCYQPCHNCIDNCIHTYAGVQLRYECAKIMRKQGYEEPTGQAKITQAYNLPCDYVIHTVGPIVQGRLSGRHKKQLESCYRSCLEIADKNNVGSIAFCCISTGVFMFPNDKAAEIAVKTVKSYKQETGSRIKVIFNVFKDEDEEIYMKLLKMPKRKITFESFLCGMPAKDYVYQDEDYDTQIKKAAKLLNEAEYVLIGEGAGLSAAAGAKYGGRFFEEHFSEFQEKYGKGRYMQDMYSAGFYPYPDEESYWGYWSKQAMLGGIELDVTPLHRTLLDGLADKKIFVLSTNADAQFVKAGLPEEKIFCTQGDYFHIQCRKGCHNKTYNAVKMFKQMDQARRDCKVPSYMVPKCPVCGGAMDMNLRKDNYFVQDEEWYKAEQRFSDFLMEAADKKLVLLELGVGFNTPMIIKYPFRNFTKLNKSANYICINLDEEPVPADISERSLMITGDISTVLQDVLKKE